MKITVFLSTYNGDRYIREQIESIMSQKGVEVFLIIRDDGSSDNTPNVLAMYDKYENVEIEYGNSLGVGKSFMSLIYNYSDKSDYYAFADQDDIWDIDKLISGVEKINLFTEIPSLYVCNQRCVDKVGNYICNRFPDDFPDQKLCNILFMNLYAGCTMIFNHALFEVAFDAKRRPPLKFFEYRIHDAWIACVASLYNPIVYDSECHMSFRRHDNNESDAEITRYKKVDIKTRWILVKRKISRVLNRSMKKHSIEYTARALWNYYSDIISPSDKIMIKTVAKYRIGFGNKIKLLRSGYLRKAAPEKKYYLYIKAILNIL